ncbi:hypothetical protein E4U09_000758 [Claviceps aff. purpurea]|uniref:Uncharacterized protein n=1 Tax=Claviceps aff. purpurea TaxID=1967640 RepID=A0A9P7QI92_9HYPO|nr:hypothetical protein E4U09_000758 [Claviceps aff. purpurea]
MEESAPKRRRVSRDTDTPAPDANSNPNPNANPDPDADPAPNPPSLQPQSQSIVRRNQDLPALPSNPQTDPQNLEQQRAASPSPSPSPSQPTGTASRPARGPDRTARQLFAPRAVPAPDPDNSRTTSFRPINTARPASSGSSASVQSGLGSPPRRTPVKPSSRPLPPPAPEGDDELSTYLSRTQRITRNTGVLIPPPPEPELPPAVSDPISSTPPRGIHSSPRWRDGYRQKQKQQKKKKKTKHSPMKSSPLKPRNDSPSGTPRARGLSQSQSPHSRARTIARPLRDLGLNANTSAARQVPAPSKNAARFKERDRLRKEIALLRKEMDIAARENERIRAMQRAGRIVTPANEEDVLSLVQKTLVATGTAPSPGLAHQMAQAALKPMGILPFGPSKLIPQQQQGDVERGNDEEAEIKSHHPVQMSAEDELPFLQLFSPFSATSHVSVLPALPNQPIRQRRQITLRSRDVPGLFTARVDMVVNAMNLNILALKVPALEPSARPELGAFVDKLCNGDCNRSMHHNIGIISWAMGEWYRLATQRARFWSQLEQSLATKDEYLRSVALMRDAPEERDTQHEEALDLCDKADLLRFMGQRSYEIAVPSGGSTATQERGGSEAAIRLEWNICLDWTGEAQSKMGLFVGVPGKWRKADQRGVFAKLPKLFEDLIQEGQHPRKAVRTMLALLAGV